MIYISHVFLLIHSIFFDKIFFSLYYISHSFSLYRNITQQVMCSVVDDLHLLNKIVYFWNWNKETMGVLCRMNTKMSHLFRDANCEDELIKMLNIDSSITNNSISAQTNNLFQTIP